MIEIDKLYKEKFKSYGRKPSSDAWAKIQMEIQKEGKKPAAPIVFNKKLLLAASLALLLVLGYQQWTKKQRAIDPSQIATNPSELSEVVPLAQVPLPTEVVSEESSSPIESLTAISSKRPRLLTKNVDNIYAAKVEINEAKETRMMPLISDVVESSKNSEAIMASLPPSEFGAIGSSFQLYGKNP